MTLNKLVKTVEATLDSFSAKRGDDKGIWFYTDEEIIWMNRKLFKARRAYERKKKRTHGVINLLKLDLSNHNLNHTLNYDENPLTTGKDCFILGQRVTRKYLAKKMIESHPDWSFYETNPTLAKAWWCYKSNQPCFERAKEKGKHCRCGNCQAFVYSLWAVDENDKKRNIMFKEGCRKSTLMGLTVFNGAIALALILRELPGLLLP